MACSIVCVRTFLVSLVATLFASCMVASSYKITNALDQTHDDTSNTNPVITLSEAEQIALEVTFQLLPPEDLSAKIARELKLIKYKYRVVSRIEHQRRWIPGQLVTKNITPEQIRQVNNSEFGPLVGLSTSHLSHGLTLTTLSFGKPYNPLALRDLLSFKFGFSSSPAAVVKEGSDIFYDPSTATYIFKRVPECLLLDRSPCDEQRHYWEFIVSSEGNVRLIKEYDIDPEGNRDFEERYFALYTHRM